MKSILPFFHRRPPLYLVVRSTGLTVLLIGMLAGAGVTRQSHAQIVRVEMHAFESETLTDQAFLNGGEDGLPVTITGELRLPLRGDERLPTVVLLHGSGGATNHMDGWVQELNAMGVATFLVDSFTGRGISSTIHDQSQLGRLAMIADAYRALERLATHPRIDGGRIALMGFSRGGQAALYASLKRFQRLHSLADTLGFAAYIAFYPLCNTTYLGDDDVTDRPIRIFHGSADDYNPATYCRAYVARLREAGQDIDLTEYSGAHHVFDWPLLKDPVYLAEAQVVRNCRLEEGPDGRIHNRDTGQPFSYGDPCVERGVTVAYDAQAHRQARQAVKDLVATVLKPNPVCLRPQVRVQGVLSFPRRIDRRPLQWCRAACVGGRLPG